MAGIKISALPAVVSALTTDFFPVVQGGITSRETLAQVQTLFGFGGGILDLAHGGTNAALVASANSIVYSTASALALLASGNNGVLITSGAGVPSISSTLPSAVQTNITALGAQSQALNMNTHLINNVVDPVALQDAATKNYVDIQVANFATVFVARLATTTALTVTYANGTAGVGATLTNAGAQVALSIDGVAAIAGNLVLVKDQASTFQNGYYTVTDIGSGATNWILTRSVNYDQPSEINPGDIFVITAGTANANTSWIETATVVTVGTDPITFSQYSVAIPVPVTAGGTGRTTSTTAFGLIAAGTTATGILQTLPTGSTGQILQSGGAAALPTWSTATYPATASTTGNVLTSDGTNFISSTPTFFRTINVQLFSTPGAFTYTPTAGMTYIRVRMIGAGGGGGGATGAVNQTAAGGGGASGGAYEFYCTAAQIGASKTGSIGTGGTAGANTGGNGGAGGNTVFFDWTGGGGGGGIGSVASVATKSSAGGSATASTTGTGMIIGNFVGNGGLSGWCDTIIISASGGGGQPALGLGYGGTPFVLTTAVVAGGQAPTGYGGGASGGATLVNANVTGGVGGNGVVIIEEYISV